MGPIVRYVDARRAAIWLELPREGAVLATARAVTGRKRTVESEVARTVEVYEHHYAVVYLAGLDPGTLYAYELDVVFDRAGPYAFPRDIRRSPDRTRLDLSGLALGRPPAFSTLPDGDAPPRRGRRKPAEPPALRVAFGSCRCFGNGFAEAGNTGPDVLAAYAEHLAATAGDRLTTWPHALLLLGDQIYADNVAHDTAHGSLPRIARPDRRPLRHALWPYVDERIAAGKLPPSAGAGGFHLYTFHDFALTYRDAWTRPPLVRALLAHLPTFMLPDDHEFTDDYLFSGRWLQQVLADAPWRTTLANAMLAYWLYQGWGNLSHDAAAAHPFLRHVMREAEGHPRHVGGIGPQLYRLADQINSRTLDAPAYFSIATTPPIIAIDARTDRRFAGPAPFPIDGRDPTLIIDPHPEDQLLSDAQFTWLEQQLARHETPILLSAIPILQTPVADRLMLVYTRRENTLFPILETQTILDGAESVARDADAETWFAFPRSLNRLLRLLSTRKTTYVLSGDVHYSYVYDVPETFHLDTTKLSLAAMKAATTSEALRGRSPSRLVNIVCSPLQNEWNEQNVRMLEELGGQHKVGDLGVAVFDGVTPQTHPWRNLFGLPRSVWTRSARPVDATDGPTNAYGTRNCIAVAAWLPHFSVTFFGITADGRFAAVGGYPVRPREM